MTKEDVEIGNELVELITVTEKAIEDIEDWLTEKADKNTTKIFTIRCIYRNARMALAGVLTLTDISVIPNCSR